MPDKITQEEQDQLEKRRRQAAKVDWNKIAQWKAPDVKYAWVDPPKQDKYEPRVAPLPNDNGQTPEVVRLPFDPSKPDQNQRMPYLIDRESATQTEQSKDQNSASIAPKQRIPEWMQQQKAQEITPPARFDYASPLSKGLAKILSISNENPREADRLRGFVQQSAKDPDSPYWRPYARPTNNVPMQELQKLGVDTSNLNRDWFEKNAWLKKYVRVGTSGLPMPPKDDSSKEEKAAYYYTRLMDAQNTTDRAEMELTGLKREIGYWANRKDRNYSDGEVLSRIEWRNYPTLSLLRADGQQGLPTEVNKAIDFDDDTELGMLWSARNKKTSSSHTMDAARYALGEGITYQPDDVVRAMRDPGSPAYHPYALGSTVDEPAQYFGVDAFDKTWLQKNRHILDSGNKTAKFMYNTVYDAERFTRQAEAELKDLTGTVNAKLDQAFAWGKADGEGILRDAYANYPALRRMDEGRSSGKLPLLTRPVIYRYEDIAAQVKQQADILGKRMGSTQNSDDLQAAAQNEKAAEIAAQGSALQLDIAPKSRTARKNLLWEDGLLAGVSPSMQGAGFPPTEEGAVSAAARGILRTALSGEDEAENQQAQAGISRMADMLLNIREEAAGKIASFFGAVTGKSATARPGTAGLVSLIVETGADVLGTITKHLLEEEDHSLPFLQTLSGLLQLRRAATGEETDAEKMTNQALSGAVTQSLSGAQVKTGNASFDGIATVAAQSGSSVETAQKRWGNAGVNYFANLNAAGRGDVAAILQTLPSYAKSVVVAEQNMRTMALIPSKLYSQLMALKQDLQSPEITQNAIRRGRLQAESALIGQKVAGGALAGLSAFQKDVDDAKAQSDKDQSALNQAKKKEQAITKLHAAASAKFLSNLADSAATDGLLSVLDQWQAAKEKRKQAEQAAESSQNTLASAQEKLHAENQQIMETITAQVKREIDDRLAKARDMLKQVSGIPLNVSIDSDTAPNDVSSLASVDGNSIIKEDRRPLESDTATLLPGAEMIPFRALAFAGAATDVQYNDGIRDAQSVSGLSSSSSGGGKGAEYGPDGDVEVYWKDMHPNQVQIPSRAPLPSPLPTSTKVPEFTINIFKTGDYARNKNIYQGVTDSTLMPLAYLKQGQAQLKKEGVIYPGDGIIYHYDPELSYDEDQLNAKGKGKGKRRLETDCIGMLVLPAMMWYSDATFSQLKDKDKKIKTSTDNTYANSSHKGKFTKDIIENGKMFDGMVLMGEDNKGEPEHAVIFYKEFEYDGVVHKNVVVDISGYRYKRDPVTGRSIVDEKTKQDNAGTKIRIRTFEEAYEDGEYVYWCAPDYIDYGNQKDPVTGELLTPKKTIDKGKKK